MDSVLPEDLLCMTQDQAMRVFGWNEETYFTNLERVCHEFNRPAKTIRYTSFLVEKIDECLGKLPSLGITEICGESGTGKTLIALQLTKSTLLNGKRVIYMCTEAIFPIQRLCQLMDENMLNDVLVYHLGDLEIQESFINYHLRVSVENNDVGLIVLDSITANFRIDNQPKHIQAETYQRLANSLKCVSYDFNIPVLVINQVSANFETLDLNDCYGSSYNFMPFYKEILNDPALIKLIPSLGLSWANCVNHRIFLTKKRRMYVQFSHLFRCSFVDYEIEEGGLVCH